VLCYFIIECLAVIIIQQVKDLAERGLKSNILTSIGTPYNLHTVMNI